MVRIIFVIFYFFSSISLAQDESLPTKPEPNEINGLVWVSFPTGTVTTEEIASDVLRFSWQPIINDDGIPFYAGHTIFIRFKAPYHLENEMIISQIFAHANGTDNLGQNQLFLLDEGKLKPIRLVPDRYAAFLITKELYGREFLMVSNKVPYPTRTKITILALTWTEFIAKKEVDRSFLGFLFGCQFIMLFYNFLMLLFFKRSYLLYYNIYLFGIIYISLMTAGYLPVNRVTHSIIPALLLVIPTSIMLFSFSVLDIKSDYPRLYKLGVPLLVVLAFLVMGIYLDSMTSLNLLYAFAPLTMIYSFSLAAIVAIRGSKLAYPMLAGWLSIFIAMILMVCDLHIENFPNMDAAISFAVVFEIVTFSFAMNQKIRLSEMKVMRENHHAFNQMRKMIYTHQLERIRKGDELETTMPTAKARAVVLSFDICESSKIDPAKAKGFLRNVFSRCSRIMSEGYDGIHLQANAYRIKEMGDGFLCSIGYPFASMSSNPVEAAVILAQRFAKVLAEESKQLGGHAVTCGIGIVEDELSGFYPDSGTKEYDIFGRALILATRYEGMRKVLFEGRQENSVIILQKAVWDGLDASKQKDFTRVNLHENHLVIRDDPEATVLYYHSLNSEKLPELKKAG